MNGEGATFPKSARLSRRDEFERVRNSGRSCGGKWFRMSVLQSDQVDGARLGIITTRKVGPATERNRFRRLIREIFRLHRRQLPAGLWIVIIARSGSGTAPHASLRDEWLRHLARLSIVDGSR